jgi:hypothetical protein
MFAMSLKGNDPDNKEMDTALGGSDRDPIVITIVPLIFLLHAWSCPV